MLDLMKSRPKYIDGAKLLAIGPVKASTRRLEAELEWDGANR